MTQPSLSDPAASLVPQTVNNLAPPWQASITPLAGSYTLHRLKQPRTSGSGQTCCSQTLTFRLGCEEHVALTHICECCVQITQHRLIEIPLMIFAWRNSNADKRHLNDNLLYILVLHCMYASKILN